MAAPAELWVEIAQQDIAEARRIAKIRSKEPGTFKIAGEGPLELALIRNFPEASRHPWRWSSNSSTTVHSRSERGDVWYHGGGLGRFLDDFDAGRDVMPGRFRLHRLWVGCSWEIPCEYPW